MRPILLAVLVFLPDCAASTRPQGGLMMGAIAGYNDDDPRIEITTSPRSATVKVTTYGGGCHSKGETEVRVGGMQADVTPFDHAPAPETICTMQLLSFVHEATIPFPSSGTARIRVRGLKLPADTLVVERTVVIP